MSQIQQTLSEATDITPSKRANETITDQAYLERLALGVQDLSEEDWNKLPTEAKDWFNAAADAIEQKKTLPEFPDMTPPAASAGTRRRGGTPASAPMKSTDAKKGDKVVATNKRGKTYTGEVIEADDQGIVLNVDGKEIELDHDKIETISMAGGTPDGAGAADPEPAEPEVSDTVEVTTKRGKIVVGNITEMTDTDLVITDAAGEIHEFDRERLTSIVVKVKNAGRRITAAAEQAPVSAAVPTKRTTMAINGGVSITTRIRELVADNLTATKDQISTVLKKEGLEFKQATLDLTFSDMHKIIGILRNKKLVK